MPIRVSHTESSAEKGRTLVYPRTVQPYQPFTDIAALMHPLSSGGTVAFDFEGPPFEMEDQRQWCGENAAAHPEL